MKKIKEILFITGNQSKLEEAINIARKYSVKVLGKKINLPELIEMDGEKILIKKAKYAFGKFKRPLIVDEAGIYFEAYPNFPGVFTKYIIKLLGFHGIFKLLRGESRKAYFKSTIAFIDNSSKSDPMLFEGICKGRITKRISKVFDPNFEFNSIFVPERKNRTFSEMSIKERGKFSHRAQSLEKFLKWCTDG